MIVTIVGGAGVRTPLLVRGLAASDLPLAEVRLYDTDQARLALMAPVARELAEGVDVQSSSTLPAAVEGADLVFTSIRAGGIQARAHDEAAALRHGLVGQETVGAAGFAMAMRNVPPLVACAREVTVRAPRAWLINFANPVGIVTQALRDETDARVLGICDTPTELFERAALALGLPAAECEFDYFGLNHLGWLREVRHLGAPQLGRLWGDAARLSGLYGAPLFEPGFLASLRLLPTEYLFFYYRPERAVANMRRAGSTRGEAIERLNAELFAELARATGSRRAIYERYLTARDAGYMQLESGVAKELSPQAAELSGYDRIALSVARALHHGSGAVVPLSVTNNGALSDLRAEDVVEVPCRLDAGGGHPQPVGRVPEQVRELLLRVKDYERRTVRAALSRSPRDAEDALAANPLVGSRAAEVLPELRLS
jgi:6-phospho-beta-glucosidase